MAESLNLAISPCPNDTFIFHALIHGLVDTGPFDFRATFADVQELNQAALAGRFDVVKVSAAACAGISGAYGLIASGGAMGRGVGPLVVARPGVGLEEVARAPLAVPGLMTTANALCSLTGFFSGERLAMRYDEVMEAVAENRAKAGVVIHEGRFTYGRFGLTPLLDLGGWWEEETGLPLPLGAIGVRRSLGDEAAGEVQSAIRLSLEYARQHPEESRGFIAAHACELSPRAVAEHIETFVTEFSVDAGPSGREAMVRLVGAVRRDMGLPPLEAGELYFPCARRDEAGDDPDLADKILYYLEMAGPAYVKKLAEVVGADWKSVEGAVAELAAGGLVERVPGSEIIYRDESGARIVKHMNHTYYRPTRQGRRTARAMEPPDVVLSPPWKRASRG